MKVLWAPWRMEYILTDQEKGECIFCPGDDRSQDEARLILYVGSQSMVVMNRFPYINGHLLVAPVRHGPDLEFLSGEETLDLLVMVRRSIAILKEEISPEGFNVGLNLGRVAGAGYMTVFGEVRVIPEHIEETYHKLLPHFQEIKPRR
ncbi:MAG: HIT domain-containing protein [Deltaproteobacteria bacterium]|nr:HIT domain-containing protein [Deltaproteobacteria bacterium]